MTEAAHSVLGASSSKRWITCAGSIKMCKNLPKQESNIYSIQGTAAHAVGEQCLLNGFADPHDFVGKSWYVHYGDKYKNLNGLVSTKPNEDVVAKKKSVVIPITREIAENVAIYVDTVKEYFSGLPQSELFIEKRFSLAALHPSMFGTNDACVLQPFGKLVVIDYKNGFGNVEADENTQLIYYAVGAAMGFNFEFTEIEMVIVQPNVYGQPPVKTYTIGNLELLEWKVKLQEAAYKTEAEHPELIAGDHCMYCPAAIHGCPAYNKMRDEALMDIFHTPTTTEITPDTNYVLSTPDKLTNEQIAKLMLFCENFSKYEKAVAAEAFNRAERGEEIPFFKLAEGGKGHRKWVDEKIVETKFSNQYGDDIFEEPALLSPAQMEKLVGKEAIKGLTCQPDGKLTLVRIEDKREAVEPPKSLTTLFFD